MQHHIIVLRKNAYRTVIRSSFGHHLKLTWMTELLHTIALEVWSMAIQYSNRQTYSRLYGLVFPCTWSKELGHIVRNNIGIPSSMNKCPERYRSTKFYFKYALKYPNLLGRKGYVVVVVVVVSRLWSRGFIAECLQIYNVYMESTLNKWNNWIEYQSNNWIPYFAS